MSLISIELVPRNYEQLKHELNLVKTSFRQITAVNIPDLLRFEIRSWVACEVVNKYCNKCIPHIRAIDFDLKSDFKLKEYFQKNNINEILVIRGDDPQVMTKKIYPTTTVEFSKKIKKEIPDIKIYGGIDQYRSNIRDELEYINRKIDAGIDGFFTQPFFDIRLLEIYAEKIETKNIYWGISPVISEQSKLYWETRNRAVFPKDFEHNLEWNVKFSKKVLEFSKNNNYNVYFMPIKIDLKEYLTRILLE